MPLVSVLVRRLVPERRVVFVRWGFSHVAFAATVGIATLWASGLVARPVLDDLDVLTELYRTALVQGAMCCVAVLAARRLDPVGEVSLGWRTDGLVRAGLAGVAAYVVLFPSLTGVHGLWPWVLERLGEEAAAQPLLEAFPGPGSPDLPLAALMAVAVVPLLEETLFRGFLQPLLVQNLNDAAGVVLTSLLFALLHGTSAFLPIFCLSLLLGGVMLRTQRLPVVWGLHALHNGLVLVVALLVPQAAAVPV